jgi:carboxymethylenebutenolidase
MITGSWWALWLLLAGLPALAAPDAETVTTADGQPFTAYVDGPQDAERAVVLVQDWFGVTPFYLEAAERLAQQGYRVVAVDLYGGKHASTHDEARALLQATDAGHAGAIIDAAIESLRDERRKLGVMSFSAGASYALPAALRHDEINATVIWYGDTVNDPAKLAELSGPLLFVVGSQDGPAADRAAALSKAADAAGKAAEIYIYPGAAHAFAQPLFNQGQTFDPVATEASWRVTEDFLLRHLR